MSKQVLLETEQYIVWDDGTFRYNSWASHDESSQWRIVDGNLEFKHAYKPEWRVTDSDDRAFKDQWANKIIAILVERELFK